MYDYITKNLGPSKSKVLTHSPVFVQLVNKHQEFLVVFPPTAARQKGCVEASEVLTSGSLEVLNCLIINSVLRLLHSIILLSNFNQYQVLSGSLK